MYPILFKIGKVAVHSYGLMAAIAILVGYYLALKNSPRYRIEPRKMETVALLVVLGGLVGARLIFVLQNMRYFLAHPLEIVFTWHGGLSWHGALLGGTLAALAYARRAGIPVLDLLDCLAPIAAIGLAIGRIGCFLNGCCYGGPTDLPWAVRFHSSGGELTPPSHPAQLYAFVGNLLLFIGLWRWQGRRQFRGHVFLAYLAWYSVLRAALEWIRKGATADVAFDGMTRGQVASAIIFVAAIALIWLGRRRASRVGEEGEARRHSRRRGK